MRPGPGAARGPGGLGGDPARPRSRPRPSTTLAGEWRRRADADAPGERPDGPGPRLSAGTAAAPRSASTSTASRRLISLDRRTGARTAATSSPPSPAVPSTGSRPPRSSTWSRPGCPPGPSGCGRAAPATPHRRVPAGHLLHALGPRPLGSRRPRGVARCRVRRGDLSRPLGDRGPTELALGPLIVASLASFPRGHAWPSTVRTRHLLDVGPGPTWGGADRPRPT